MIKILLGIIIFDTAVNITLLLIMLGYENRITKLETQKENMKRAIKQLIRKG